MPTLYLWGKLDAAPVSADSSFAIPSLDPTSLYAASLLRLRQLTQPDGTAQQALILATPSPILHRVLPRLELDSASNSGSVIEGISRIQTALTSSSQPSEPATAAALHATLEVQLQPLVLHALFSNNDNFRRLAAPTYSYSAAASPSSSAPPSSLPPLITNVSSLLTSPFHVQPRLRNNVQAHLIRTGIWGLAGSAQEEKKKELRAKRDRRLGSLPEDEQRGDGPVRVRVGKDGHLSEKLARSTRKEMDIGWDNSKLTTLAEKPLNIVNSALSQSSASAQSAWLLGASEPSSFDLHLFSLLAPILFAPSSSSPPAPLRKLLEAQYPLLVQHTSRIGDLLWRVRSVPAADVTTSERRRWEWGDEGQPAVLRARDLPSRANLDQVTLTSAASYLASSARHAPSAAWSSLKRAVGLGRADAETRSRGHAESAHQQGGHPHDNSDASPMVRPENLGWGRFVWISTAVVGFISFIFVSGLVTIEFVEDGAEDEGDELTEDGDQASSDDGTEGDLGERRADMEEALLEEGEEQDHESEAEDGEAGVEEDVVQEGEELLYFDDDDDDD
ncbi:hypothetical protein OC846_003608 [Tilletia horrida]|uniref:Mitochondrial outer membrane transport complex Sam37/metaxin N-terminal domain-containing protein n=1 Tax=Tilletia horrida TaxID=155126 RepID=A0AAN6GS65_9BASI|nr:hypothetical protein OC846_003608 [Tilletia horrida]KAK0550882.1 hypothetical protein OC845_002445 [Tilletia horrida]KAK0565745.1 hypothetical protein OC861_003615 [Tilletia horrida]